MQIPRMMNFVIRAGQRQLLKRYYPNTYKYFSLQERELLTKINKQRVMLKEIPVVMQKEIKISIPDSSSTTDSDKEYKTTTDSDKEQPEAVKIQQEAVKIPKIMETQQQLDPYFKAIMSTDDDVKKMSETSMSTLSTPRQDRENEEVQILRQKVEDAIKQVLQLDKEDWKLIKNKNDLKVYTGPENGPILQGKIVGIINHKKRIIRDVMINHDQQKHFDPFFETGHIDKVYDQNLYLCYQRYKRMLFLQGRDMYTVSHCRRLPDGNIIMVVFSDPDYTVPKEKGFIRAEVKLGGVILRSLEDDPSKTQITMLQWADTKLNLGAKIQEYALCLQSFNIGRLEKYISQTKEKGVEIKPPYPFVDDYLYED